ncbi:diguanylate cyclase [Azospira restricta]|uniref:diguanylate cyclase n=1 Tax=Azospira restricta TaxID=404405 RepID=A0A974Y392_9RHOO|nr:diguanylate cyclase [Azospira restricta]QRJ63755.1 diguanylate cyclase [Azospira restricta]
MQLTRIRHKMLAVVGLTAALGFVTSAYYYVSHQEQALLAQNEQTMVRLAESVSQGLQSVMLAGSADIAQAFADNLKKIAEVSEFRIMRSNGEEAFRDNATIDDVNRRRGEELFWPRDEEKRVPILTADDARLQQVVNTRQPLMLYDRANPERSTLTFMLPVPNAEQCYKCHGSKSPVRGVVMLTTSLARVERDILKTRQNVVVLLGGALMLTMLLTGYTLGRAVIRPIEKARTAMAAVSGGDLESQMKIGSSDEIGQMASSFNLMTDELRRTYAGLRREQAKLTTIIQSSAEGIVVTDSEDRIVLVNPAAATLLGKSEADIVREGFLGLFDAPEEIVAWLSAGDHSGPHMKMHGDRHLRVFVNTIRHSDGALLGTVAQIRDMTEELQLEGELRRLSTTDGLTGLYNRRHLENTLRSELDRARRTRQPLAIVMFDVDHFKRFNDTHGHDQGDRVLQAVAAAMRAGLRGTDVPCRYGGEEFLGILPATPLAAAAELAEGLRTAVEAMEVDGLRVTISLGVAALPEIDTAIPDTLIAAADAALYRAKEGGRNRVAIAGTSAADGSGGPA